MNASVMVLDKVVRVLKVSKADNIPISQKLNLTGELIYIFKIELMKRKFSALKM